MTRLRAECRPMLIGSLPLADHNEAFQWVISATPDIPVWVQLPAFSEEQMIPQFAPGMPGLAREADRMFIDNADQGFEDQLLAFYEDFMAISEGSLDLDSSRFIMDRTTAMGLHVFLERFPTTGITPVAVKGQVTGPVTFGLGLHDREGRAVFYDLHARDAAVKLLAMKAQWQVQQLKSLGAPVVVFVDEPALAGYGSSELISVSREEIIDALGAVIGAIHQEGALAGVHVCANTDWSMILESGTDLVNFDAYIYFERFILYPEAICTFVENGGLIAWGIVPTGDADTIDRETGDSLYSLWEQRVGGMLELGVARDRLMTQSLITPSCGTGSLSSPRARKVIDLTCELSQRIRKHEG